LTKIGPEDFFTDPLAQGLHPNCVWSALYPGRWLRPNRAAGALSFGFPLALARGLHPNCVWSALYPGRWLRPNRAAGALSFGFPLALAPSLHPLCVNDLPSALEQPYKGAPVRTSPARF